jgi:hypothetical protein
MGLLLRIAEVQLYDNEYVCLPWERVEDIDVWCHEITEMEAANLIPSLCGFIFIGGRERRRCDKLCIPEHQVRITEDYAWPPPHMFASIAFGCGIELENGWLTLNADQCWCLVKKH